MKVIIAKEQLVKNLNTVLKAVPSRTTLEILKCVHLEAEDEFLTLTTNDTQLGIETKSQAIVEEPGSIAVDAGLFSSIIRNLPDNDITIETDAQNNISIKCEQAFFTIGGRGTDDFIFLPSVNAAASVSVSQLTVREMINQVIFSISDSNLNAAMGGVYIEVFDSFIKMTTLDGHRISIRKNELNQQYQNSSAIVPGKTLNDLSKILSGDHDKDVMIYFAKNYIMFEFDQTKVVSRVIDGEYFKIDAMLRNEEKTHLKVNKKDFIDCLNRSVILISESDHKPVIIDIIDDQMSIRLKSAKGVMNEHLFIEKEGQDLKIAFNPKLLIDALRVIDDEEIDLYLVASNFPCTIKDAGGMYMYVVLPVTFTEE